MKHIAAFLVALLIDLAVLALAASRSHQFHHVSDARVVQAEGLPPAPALLSHKKEEAPCNGAGRLGLLTPTSPAIEQKQGGVGLIIPDDEAVGRLRTPRPGKPGREWQELIIKD